jgi:hypothetical protein
VKTLRVRSSLACVVAAALVAPAVVARAAAPGPPVDATRPQPPFWSSLSLAATYGGAIRSGALWHGPGVILAVDEPRWLADPDVWLEARRVFPQGWEQPTNIVQTISARAGVSARLSAHVRLGVGGGVDREAMSFTAFPKTAPRFAMQVMAPDWQPAARVFARLLSGSWRGFAASATAFADAVHAPDPQNTFRAGFTVEGWWRSGGD